MSGKEKTVAHYIGKIGELLQKQQEESGIARRYGLFPLQDPESWKYVKLQEQAMWNTAEMEFSRDKPDYERAPQEWRDLVDKIMGFFVVGDGLVVENISLRFMFEAPSFEAKLFFIVQMDIERVHAETYSLIVDALKSSDAEKQAINEMADTVPYTRHKADWMVKYMYADIPRAERFVAFACAEGIFFCVLFAAIFWFRSKGVFQNLIFANEQIAKDESLHRDYGAMLYRRYRAETTPENVVAIVRDAVAVEEEFADFLLPEPIEEFNATDLKRYCRVVADSLLVALGHAKIFNERNPFPWMSDICLPQKPNFYEVKGGNYRQHSGKAASAGEITSASDDPLGVEF